MPYIKDNGGVCPICNQFVRPLEFHHVCYNPVRGVRICHNCHWKIHHYPDRLTERVLLWLKQLRGSDCKQTERIV